MKARYAGTCTKTGKSYKAGTEIVKGTKGWEIANSSEIELRNLGNGNRMMHDFSRRPIVCGACAKADVSYDQSRASSLSYRPEYQLKREGDLFVCPTCGAQKACVVGTEADWELGILPRLKFVGTSLNEKVGADKWEKIKAYFEYTSYADLADWYDQCDEFAVAEMYEGMRGGEWSLKNASDMGKVEDILGILPHNRHDYQPPTEPETTPETTAEKPNNALPTELGGVELEGTPSGPASPNSVAWIKIDATHYAGLDNEGSVWIGRQANTPPKDTWGYIQGRYAHAVKYPFTLENRQRVLDLLPNWALRAFAGEDVRGRFVLPYREGVAANAADAIRGCKTSKQPLNQVEFIPDAEPVSIVKSSGVYAALVVWSDGKTTRGSFESVSLWGYRNGYGEGFPTTEQQLSFDDSISEDAQKLIKDADAAWLSRVSDLVQVQAITERKTLQEVGSQHTGTKLEELTCTLRDGGQRVLYRVEWEWGGMCGGEGDAGGDIRLLDDKDEALEAYKEYSIR